MNTYVNESHSRAKCFENQEGELGKGLWRGTPDLTVKGLGVKGRQGDAAAGLSQLGGEWG